MSRPVTTDNARRRSAKPTMSVLIPFLRDDPSDLLQLLDEEAGAVDGTVEIVLLDDGDDSTEQHGSWTRRSGLTAWPATAALIDKVESMGGALGWRNRNGVACTRDEDGL